MNLNSFMANTIKQECSTELATVQTYLNKCNLKKLKSVRLYYLACSHWKKKWKNFFNAFKETKL